MSIRVPPITFLLSLEAPRLFQTLTPLCTAHILALDADASLPPLPKAVRANHGFIPAPSPVRSCTVSVCLQNQAHFGVLM